MIILVDTLEKKNSHITSAFDEAGVVWKPQRLAQGDYMTEDNETLTIDRKNGLQEVYGNLIGREHDRFIRECERAKAQGQKLIVLVETHDTERYRWCECKEPDIKCLDDVHKWKNPREKLYYSTPHPHFTGSRTPRPPCSATKLQKIMQTVAEKHGVEWRFIKSENCGNEIIKILENQI